jgi:hypothetical protein
VKLYNITLKRDLRGGEVYFATTVRAKNATHAEEVVRDRAPRNLRDGAVVGCHPVRRS